MTNLNDFQGIENATKETLNIGIEKITNITSENLDEFLKLLSKDIQDYLKEYEKAFRNFQVANRLVRQIKNLSFSRTLEDSDQSKEDKKGVIIARQKYRNEKKETQNFILILQKGQKLLHQIRQLLTGQVISTVFTIEIDKKLYRVSEEMLKGYLKPILSTFGNSPVNPFSLALELDINSLREDLINFNEKRIDQDDIYNMIWSVKTPYLQKKWQGRKDSRYKSKRYIDSRRVFNSKDAEIYDLISQSKDFSVLTVEHYEQLRASMGGMGGYRTNQLKLGDVGLVQDKFISEKFNSVNIARMQLIYNNLKRLNSALSSNNKEKIKQALLQTFTEKEKNLKEDIDKQLTQEAKKMIEELFVNKLDKIKIF